MKRVPFDIDAALDAAHSCHHRVLRFEGWASSSALVEMANELVSAGDVAYVVPSGSLLAAYGLVLAPDVGLYVSPRLPTNARYIILDGVEPHATEGNPVDLAVQRTLTHMGGLVLTNAEYNHMTHCSITYDCAMSVSDDEEEADGADHDGECVAALEELTALAKTGRLTGFTIIGNDEHLGTFHASAGYVGSFAMIGALESAKLSLLDMQGED